MSTRRTMNRFRGADAGRIVLLAAAVLLTGCGGERQAAPAAPDATVADLRTAADDAAGGLLPAELGTEALPQSPFVQAVRSTDELTETICWHERGRECTCWRNPAFVFEIDPSAAGKAAMARVAPTAEAVVEDAELRLWRLEAADQLPSVLRELAEAHPGGRFAPCTHTAPSAGARLRVPTGNVFAYFAEDAALGGEDEVAAWAAGWGYEAVEKTPLLGNVWLLKGKPLPERLEQTRAMAADPRVEKIAPETIVFR